MFINYKFEQKTIILSVQQECSKLEFLTVNSRLENFNNVHCTLYINRNRKFILDSTKNVEKNLLLK